MCTIFCFLRVDVFVGFLVTGVLGVESMINNVFVTGSEVQMWVDQVTFGIYTTGYQCMFPFVRGSNPPPLLSARK